jgi:two-component system chemotaxis response regulator CheY
MNQFLDQVNDPEVVEVMEGLLNLCMLREDEIEKLEARIEVLEARLGENKLTMFDSSRPRPPQQGEHKGILVVDDSDIMRIRLVDLLSTNGYRVVGQASDGARAVELYQQKRPAVVTMDLDMPVLDGYEATKKIKQMDPHAQVVVISQVLDRQMILRALNAGAVDFLVKPLKIERFLQLIERLVTPPQSLSAET